MVMVAVIRKWVTVVALTEAGVERLSKTVQDMEAYFYADDGPISLPQPERLQMSFELLTELFEWFGLCTNMRKIVSMACRPCHAPGRFSEAAYYRRVNGIG